MWFMQFFKMIFEAMIKIKNPTVRNIVVIIMCFVCSVGAAIAWSEHRHSEVKLIIKAQKESINVKYVEMTVASNNNKQAVIAYLKEMNEMNKVQFKDLKDAVKKTDNRVWEISRSIKQ